MRALLPRLAFEQLSPQSQWYRSHVLEQASSLMMTLSDTTSAE